MRAFLTDAIVLLCLSLPLSVLLLGCGSADPTAAEEKGGLRVVGHEADTLYLAESTWWRLAEDLPEISRLKFYHGTTSHGVDSVRGRMLYFTTPSIIDGGAYRLYKDDSVITGIPAITMIDINASYYHAFPMLRFGDCLGRVGDVISIEGIFPERKGVFAVWLNGAPVRLLFHNSRTVQFRVTANMSTSTIKLRVLDKDTVVGTLRILQDEAVMLPLTELDSFSVTAQWLRVQSKAELPNGKDTLVEDHYHPRFASRVPLTTSFVNIGDTTIWIAHAKNAYDSCSLTIKQSRDSDKRTSSGWIEIYQGSRSSGTRMRMRLENVSWRKESDGSIVLALAGLGVAEHLKEGSYGYEQPGFQTPGRMFATNYGSLLVRLVPKR